MVIAVDFRSKIPIYEQIIYNIKEQVLFGKVKPNEPMPSMRQLASELGINSNTIQKAYAELKRQGIIHSLSGRGAFVSDIPEMKKLTESKREELCQEIKNALIKAQKLNMGKTDVEKIINEVY